MKIRATLNKAGHVTEHYDFDFHGDDDFAHGAAAAYAHFHQTHPGFSVIEDGVQITFAKYP